jgi:hypothetical protein
MKTFLKTLVILTLLSSCSPKEYYTLVDGTVITEKQRQKMIKKSIKNAYKDLSKEDKKTLKSTNIYIDTVSY